MPADEVYETGRPRCTLKVYRYPSKNPYWHCQLPVEFEGHSSGAKKVTFRDGDASSKLFAFRECHGFLERAIAGGFV